MPQRLYRHFVLLLLDEVSSDVSCGNDAKDVLGPELEEPVDNPGTTIGTKFSVLQRIVFAICGKLWWETAGPLVRASVSFAELPMAVS